MNRVTAIRAIKNSNNNAKCQSQMTYAEVTKKNRILVNCCSEKLTNVLNDYLKK